MDSTRKKISIYDYPEHLNPFSEPTLTASTADKRKIFVDKLRKNGTWSSKITKRVSRSVTWIEKSWLAAEDSKKNKNQSVGAYIRNHENDGAIQSEISKKTPLSECTLDSNEKCGDDYQRTRERIRETIVNPNEISSAKCDEEKQEIKKKKKRPAPPPPNSISDTRSTPTENIPSKSDCTYTSNEEDEKTENLEANAPVIINHSTDLSSVNNTPVEEEEPYLSDSEKGDPDSINSSSSNHDSRLSETNVSVAQSNESQTNETDSSLTKDEESEQLEDNLERVEISNCLTTSENEPPAPKKDAEHVSIISINSHNEDNNNEDEHTSVNELIEDNKNLKFDENANSIHCFEVKNNIENESVNENGILNNGQAVQV